MSEAGMKKKTSAKMKMMENKMGRSS